jgi:hypothetical protein
MWRGSILTRPRDERSFVLRDPQTENRVQQLTRAFPVAQEHRRALKILRSDFSYAANNGDGTWTALIHFSPGIEGLFGLTREIVALYSPHQDLQPRTFEGLPTIRARLAQGRAAENHLYFVFTPDFQATRKLDNWGPGKPYMALALPRSGSSEDMATMIQNGLLQRLAKRNLYDETLPVTGRDFFGRSQLIQQLSEELRQGNVCGVYGLRKTGKTSLIKELGERFQAPNSEKRIFVLLDLEALPTDPGRVQREFLEDLRASLLVEFRKRDVRRLELGDLSAGATSGEFRRALRASLADCAEKNIQVVVALDEVESLVGDAKDVQRRERDFVPELLGMLRSLVQETAELNVMLSGITSAVTERDELYGRENPLFSWAKSLYVPPMGKAEIDALTVEVGSRMAVRWEPDAVNLLSELSGGHVFLHRTLATKVVADMPLDIARRVVTVNNVVEARTPWRADVLGRLRTMWMSAERYYPTECDLLSAISLDASDSNELSSVYVSETNRLIQLDLLRKSESGALTLGPLTLELRNQGVL